MTPKFVSKDPVIRGSWPALKRAARRARELAIATGTPLWVWRDGKVVDINPVRSKRRRKRG
jgi:hypothetical protein